MKTKAYGVIMLGFLLAVSASAQVFLKVDEARLKAEFAGSRLQTALAVESSSPQALNAMIRLEILDAEDKILAAAETLQSLKRGRQDISLPLDFAQKEDAGDLLWKRLRYRVEPENSAGAISGIVSLSEIMPEVFELQISTTDQIFAGMNLRAHVLALHPVSKKPIRNVVVTGALALDLETDADEDELIIKANGKTNAEGYVTLDFKIPVGVRLDGCCSELKIKGAKNGIVREAEEDFDESVSSFVYLNTDKPIYQPAQKFFARGLYLDPFRRPVAGAQLEFEIEDESGETVHSGRAQTSRFGVMNIEWQIPENFKLGTYRLEIENEDGGGGVIGLAEFKVSRYDLPNFKVTTRADKPFYLPDQTTAEITVSAEYLFGKPVAAGRVKIVREKERRWNYEAQEYETETGESHEGETDAEGKFTARLDLAEAQQALQRDDWKRFTDLKFAAYFTDATTMRTEQRRFDVRLSKEPIHIYFMRQAADANPKLPFLFYISTFYADGAPAKCDLKIEGNYKDTTLLTELAEAKTNLYGASRFEVRFPEKTFPEAKDDFDFRVVADDRKGSRGMFADNVSVDEKEKQLRVATDKTVYAPNEAIAAKIFSTEADQTVFVSVLKNNSAIYSKRVRLGTDARAAFSIPFRPDFKGELTIAAYFRDEDSESYREYVGNSKTVLYPAANNLNLNLKSLKTVYRPGEEAQVNFNAQTGGARRPVETALGVLVLDKAIEERALTEQLPDNFSSVRKLAGTAERFGTLTRRDLDNLDTSQPIAADLQLAAEFLLAGKNFKPNFFASDSYAEDFPAIYKKYFAKKLEPLSAALKEHYEKTGEFPASEAALEEFSARRGSAAAVSTLRDAWEMPFRARFATDGAVTVLTLQTAGADKKISTDDDFTVLEMRFEWFRAKQNALGVVLNNYLQSGGTVPQTAEQLKNIWRQKGIETDAFLRDGWNRPLYLNALKYSRSTQKVLAETVGNLDGERQQVLRSKPVEQEVLLYKLRSAGANSAPGDADDFDAAAFTVVLSEKDLSGERSLSSVSKSAINAARGAVGGIVTDPNGAIVPGAQITATNQNSQETFSGKTDENGEFLLANLPSGKYRVTAESTGFQKYVIENIVVSSMNLVKLEIVLDVGSVSATVDVTAANQVTIENTSSAMISVTSSEPRSLAGFLGQNQNAPVFTPRVREYFPETLVWQPELVTDRTGRAELKFKLGDNLTTWKLYAVGSTETGEIGLIEREFQTFQPFFAELDPPRVLTTGDEIALPVPVRNYTDRRQKVSVSMTENDWLRLLSGAAQTIEVAPNASQNAVFNFRAVTPVRDGRQKVSALARGGGDAVEKSVTVKPNGKETIQTQSNLFQAETTFDVNFPADAFAGSRRTEVKIYPNMLAHVAESVEGLLKRPTGCGEQTTSSTYPNLLILKIEKEFGKPLDARLKARAKNYLDEGYQRLLNYQTPAGGFSYWGKADTPNAALTAYVLRFLSDAREFTEIDESVVASAEKWLLSQQKPGGFWESNRGGADVSTAYIARALALSGGSGEEIKSSLRAGIGFLQKRLAETKDPFVLANVGLTARAIGDAETAQKAAEILSGLAQTENGTVYWKAPNTPFYGWGATAEIETTALAVQLLIKMREAETKVKDQSPKLEDLTSRATMFLLKNKDRYGVWYSTQTTVNVLDALISLQKTQNAKGANRKLEIFVNGVRARELEISSEGLPAPFALDISEFLGQNENRVELKSAGSGGLLMAQLVSEFYVDWKTAPTGAEHFEFSVEFDKTSARIGEEITCRVGVERKVNRYGMVLAEIGIPPGADVDRAGLDRAKTNGDVSSYDVLPDKVLIYFWSGAKPLNFSFKFKPRYGINAQNAPSLVYDYYNEEAKTIVPPVRFGIK